MEDSGTPVMFTDARTGEEGSGKHYILQSTEGREVVAPDTLFGGSGSIAELEQRVRELEQWRAAQEGPIEADHSADQDQDRSADPAR